MDLLSFLEVTGSISNTLDVASFQVVTLQEIILPGSTQLPATTAGVVVGQFMAITLAEMVATESTFSDVLATAIAGAFTAIKLI